LRLISILAGCLVAATTLSAAPGDAYVPGRLSVRFLEHPQISRTQGAIRLGGDFDRILADHPAAAVEPLYPVLRRQTVPDLSLNYVLTFDHALDMESMAALFEATGKVEYAEPDYIMPVYRTPNDQYLGQQWTMNRVQAPQAWNLIPENPSNPGMIIAIIDSGVDWNHPDLINRIWVNPGEDLDGDGAMPPTGSTPGEADERNGIDDDGNGYIDDFYGWDWVSTTGCSAGEDCTEPDNNPMDFNGHGTHVSGIAAAQTNNSIGVASIAWDARIMCLRAGYDAADGNGYVIQTAAAQAIYYAIENGAKIISMSFGGSGTVRNPATAAYNSGLLCFHAAGNDNSTAQDQLDYSVGMISVASTSSNDCKSDFSNYGTWVDISAPGSAIYSTIFNNTYASLYGTSMACPNAASLAALIWWMNPELTNAEVRSRLLGTVDNIYNLGCNSAYAGMLGTGRINAYKALMNIRETTVSLGATAALDINGGHLLAGDTLRVNYSITNTGINPTEELTLTLSCPAGGIEILTPSITLPVLPTGSTYQGSNWPALIRIVDDSPQYLDISLSVSTPNANTLTATLEAMVGLPDLLVYDDSAGEAGIHSAYRNALKERGWIYDWDRSATGDFPNIAGLALDMNRYSWTIYASGQNTSTLDAGEQTLFAAYAANHHLVVSSQYADSDLAGTDFFTQVLEAQTGTSTSGTRGARGVAGSATEGLYLILQGAGGAGNQDVPITEILPAGDGATLFLDNSSVFSTGIHTGLGTYRLIYLNFALEAAGGAGASHSISEILPVLKDFLFATQLAPAAVTPAGPRLSTAWPNPFNPVTQVAFHLEHPAQVRLAAFNLLGQEVALLAQGLLPGGEHQRRFDAAGLPSGLYLLRLELDGQPAGQQKAMLIK
jgi:subtilisin family serine protease